jgi:predicted RNA-binding protein with PUA domain
MGEIQKSTFLGVTEPADVPAAECFGYWEVITPIYPNHGGKVLGVDGEVWFVNKEGDLS